MSIRTKGSLQGWDQMLALDLTLLNQIHHFWWPTEHKRKGVTWTFNNKDTNVQITGQQKEPGKFLPVDSNYDCFWYAVKLINGTVQKGNQKVPIKEWHIQFPVRFEKYLLSPSDYQDPEGLIHGGAMINPLPRRSPWDERVPKFVQGETQSPSESEVTQKLGITSLNIGYWLWPKFDHSPKYPGWSGVILRLVPEAKVSEEKYHFGPTDYELEHIYDKSMLHISAMVQNRRCPINWPTHEGENLKENTGRLKISADLFWNQWFLPNYSKFVFDTQIYPVIPDNYRIGYNPYHTRVEDSYYEFIPNVREHNGVNEPDKSVWTSAGLPGGDSYIRQQVWVNFGYRPDDTIYLEGQIDASLDDSGNWQAFFWSASLQVKEMRTNDGSVDVEIGQPFWMGFNNNSSPQWARNLYSAMTKAVTATINSNLKDLVGLKNVHKFWVPGYANFTAQDPRFIETKDLVIDMTMNGVPR